MKCILIISILGILNGLLFIGASLLNITLSNISIFMAGIMFIVLAIDLYYCGDSDEN